MAAERMRALEFTGRGGEYFRIWIVNILLTLVTLSLYYPWAKVRNRRYFLGNTTLEGRSFDYHATGKQLLPGYLIVLVLVVVYVGVQSVFPVASFALLAVLILATPWLIYRSLKFNMRMTSFSTVRFGFAGTAGGAYVAYLLWPLLFIGGLVLGPIAGGLLTHFELFEVGASVALAGLVSLVGYALAFFLYAAVKKRQTRYVIDGYRFGQGEFASGVRARGFVKILLKTIGLTLLLLIAIVGAITAVAFATGLADQFIATFEQLEDPEAIAEAFARPETIVVVGLLYLGLIVGALLIAAYAYTRQRAYILGSSTLDREITFASTLGARRFAWVLFSNLVLVVVTLGLGTPWARTRMARVLAEHTEVDTSVGFDRYVDQQRGAQSSLGEQIGDAFDVDVGIGF